MSTYTVGIVGHRTNRVGDIMEELAPSISNTLEFLATASVGDYSEIVFMVGAYNGIDRLAFQIVCALKVAHPELNIKIKTVYPSRAFTITGKKTHQEAMKSLIKLSDECIYLDEAKQVYSEDFIEMLWERNTKFSKYIVDQSDSLVAVWDGKDDSCTYNTIEYARKHNKSVATINLTGQLNIMSA